MLDGGEADIILSDDIYESIKLNTTNLPVLVSLCKVIIYLKFSNY